MKSRISTLVFILLMSQQSCKKISHTNTEINGIVINQTDNQPLVGYEVQLVETETPSKPFSPLIITTLDARVTNENGEFDFGEVSLNKRNRYSYSVEFNDNNESFASQSWQSGSYEVVNQSEQISKGDVNSVIMKQVSFGDVQVSITNRSSLGLLVFSLIIKNNLTQNQSGFIEINEGETKSNSGNATFASGKAEIEYQITNLNGDFLDTVIQSINIKPNQSIQAHLNYPE